MKAGQIVLVVPSINCFHASSNTRPGVVSYVVNDREEISYKPVFNHIDKQMFGRGSVSFPLQPGV